LAEAPGSSVLDAAKTNCIGHSLTVSWQPTAIIGKPLSGFLFNNLYLEFKCGLEKGELQILIPRVRDCKSRTAGLNLKYSLAMKTPSLKEKELSAFATLWLN